jgi:hypothetical protein
MTPSRELLINGSHVPAADGRATEDRDRYEEVIGPVCTVLAVDDEPQAPFGGTGASGYGRFGGEAAVDAFTELRWLTIPTVIGSSPSR